LKSAESSMPRTDSQPDWLRYLRSQQVRGGRGEGGAWLLLRGRCRPHL
jgi:hypothetical protein